MTINTEQHCRTNETRNMVLEGPKRLPATYMDARNFNDDAVWTEEQRRDEYYWYPYVLSDAGAPGPYYTRELGPFVIGATEVTQVASYTQYDIEVVREIKNQELLAWIPEYSTREIALDSQLNEDVVYTQEAVSVEQIKLARLTDWQQVADFPTTKPLSVSVNSNFEAKAYQRQAAELTALNQGASGSGQAVPYDQVAIDALVTANQPAADDPSGNTAAIKPDWKLRQPVSTPGEKSSIVWLYRNEAEDQYSMRLTNREPEDTRALYVFSYTVNAGVPTYLAWRVFEDQGDSSWHLESTPAEAQYVPGDMQFIFSYVGNPAVESEYFTPPVDFPAGVGERQLYVRWDTA